MLQPETGEAVIPKQERTRIEDEHDHLESFLKDLVETCTEFASATECNVCSREKSATCRGRLASFQFDFLDLIAEHIENEEEIMRKYLASPEDSQYFRGHQAEHMRLMNELRNKLMHESSQLSRQGRTVAAIRLLYEKLSEIFEEHANKFDNRLIRIAGGNSDATPSPENSLRKI